MWQQYQHASPDLERLDKRVRAALPGVPYVGSSTAPGVVILHLEAELDAAQQALLDALVPTHHEEQLDEAIVRIADAVDVETRRRIALGYSVTGLTRKSPAVPVELHFSLSFQAQLNIAGFAVALVDTWPVQWDCEDDSDALILADEAAMQTFLLTAKGTVVYRVSAGRYVRRAVVDSATIAEAEAAAATYLAGG